MGQDRFKLSALYPGSVAHFRVLMIRLMTQIQQTGWVYGQETMGNIAFGKRLARRKGIDKSRNAGGCAYLGLALLAKNVRSV